MKKQILIGGIILSFLVGAQLYWFSKAYDANASEFDHTVSVALYNVADTMSEQASVEKISSNYFYVTTNSTVSSHAIDAQIQKEFSARNLQLDYEIGVYNAKDDSLVHGKYVAAAIPIQIESELRASDEVLKNFAVLFPSRKSFLVGRMDFWMLVTFVLILISSSYFHSFFFLNKDTNDSLAKSTKIRLGKTCLDFHNQQLKVNDCSYQLTYKENKILQLLFENPNQVIEREVFLQNIWRKDGFFVARSMDVFISRIRKYLNGDQSIKIENLRSIGYRLHVSKGSK